MRIVRFMASTPLPLFDPTTSELQHGICCKGCQIALEDPSTSNNGNRYRRRDQVHSKEGYLIHFLDCPQSIALWESSERGTVSFQEPVMTRIGGFLAQLRD
jgi:hypothetical protein